MRVGPSGLGRLLAPVEDFFEGRKERLVTLAELDRRATSVGQVGRRHVGRGLELRPPPGPDAAVHDVDAVLREAVHPQQPVAADGLTVEPDVVVQHEAVALSDAPLPKHVHDLLPGRDEPLAFGVARLRRRAAKGQLRVEVAADGPRQVPPVVHAPIRRHVHDPEVLVVKVLVDPGHRHERTRIPARVRPGRRRAHQGARPRGGGRHGGWMVRHGLVRPRRTTVPPDATCEMLPLMRNGRANRRLSGR